MNLSNFLNKYYSITNKGGNSRVKQMHLYNVDVARDNNDDEELKDMYEDVIHINSSC